MRLTWDGAKRAATLAEREMDFADAIEVFAGPKFQFVDDRNDYGEVRVVTIGYLRGRMVAVVWTARGPDRQIISMRKANDSEQRRYQSRLG